jgi:hypothetical protein
MSRNGICNKVGASSCPLPRETAAECLFHTPVWKSDTPDHRESLLRIGEESLERAFFEDLPLFLVYGSWPADLRQVRG